jgi:hypothetical protein
LPQVGQLTGTGNFTEFLLECWISVGVLGNLTELQPVPDPKIPVPIKLKSQELDRTGTGTILSNNYTVHNRME